MKELNKNDLNQIVGGISTWGILGIIAGIIFGVGVVDGLIKLK